VITESDEHQFVFNVVWTGSIFSSLRYFVCSQMAQSGARFRFVANGCSPESIDAMEAFARRHPDRVEEVISIAPEMVAHGVALDEVMKVRDDGEWFCLADPDIKARAPFLAEFRERLCHDDAVTSGRGVWCETDVVPPGHPGVAGEHFFREDGFVFGSPHFAIYRRSAIEETTAKWGVSFRTAGPDIPEHTRRWLEEHGHHYRIYDTGKVLNIMLQEAHTLVHYEHPQLLHIGGLTHYLEPGRYIEVDGKKEPWWKRLQGVERRFEVAEYTAAILHASIEGHDVPEVPAGLPPSLSERLGFVRDEIVDLVETYRSW
jgi:hypothetical protein